MSQKKVIIIGAGPAGLTCGYKLLQQSKNYVVSVLEESHTVGGISRTVLHNGNRMDIGGHRFFSKNSEVNAMWQELLPLQGCPAYDDRKLGRKVRLAAHGEDPEQTDRVMLSRNRVSRIFYHKRFFDYPLRISLPTICRLGLLTTAFAGASYLWSMLFQKPESSLENFYINRFGRKLYTMFFEKYTEKLWGRHPQVISADWGEQRVKGLSIKVIFQNILQKFLPEHYSLKKETSLIEEFYYPKYGPGQFWQVTASEIEKMGGEIRFGCRVEKFIKNGNTITGIVFSNNGQQEICNCDYVVSSMPLKDLVAGVEEVPANIRAIAEGLPYRDFVTIGLLLDKLKLKNTTKLKTLSNIIPDCWIYVQEPGVKLGRIQVFNNWSPYMVKDPDNTIWIGLEYFCSENDAFWSMPTEELKKLGIQELLEIGLIGKDTQVHDFHVEKVKKAYPAYFDTYGQINELICYLNSISNLYCVGRNGQHRYNNMDHSMATSFAAVQHLLHPTDDKSAIWNVNVEKEYHEKKGC